MPAASPTPSEPSLSLIAERLEIIAHALGWGSPPMLIGLADGLDDPQSDAFHALPPVETVSADPVADLVGFVLPDDYCGFAVVTEGHGRRLADGLGEIGDIGDPTAGRTPYRFAYVLDRDGRVGFAVRPRRGGVTVDDVHDSVVDGPSGRLVDVCHRALRLATAPPPPDTAGLWLVSWLDLLLARALGRGRSVSWSEAAHLHPTMTLLDHAEDALSPEIEPSEIEPSELESSEIDMDIAPEALARMGAALARAQSWEDLRRATAAGEWSPHGMTAEQAAWMDAGVYARWVMGEFLAPAVYLRELGAVLDASVADRIRIVAAAVEPGGPVTGGRHAR